MLVCPSVCQSGRRRRAQHPPRVSIPYEPLYPTLQERLDQFRRAEQAELLQRGADHVVHNVGLCDSRRSSEDRSVDLAAFYPEDIVTPGPVEVSIGEAERTFTPSENEERPNPQTGDSARDSRPLAYCPDASTVRGGVRSVSCAPNSEPSAEF